LAEPIAPSFVSFVNDLIEVKNLIPDPPPDDGRLDQTSAGKVVALWDRHFQHRRGGP
jgi:hypothetical protein